MVKLVLHLGQSRARLGFPRAGGADRPQSRPGPLRHGCKAPPPLMPATKRGLAINRGLAKEYMGRRAVPRAFVIPRHMIGLLGSRIVIRQGDRHSEYLAKPAPRAQALHGLQPTCARLTGYIAGFRGYLTLNNPAAAGPETPDARSETARTAPPGKGASSG